MNFVKGDSEIENCFMVFKRANKCAKVKKKKRGWLSEAPHEVPHIKTDHHVTPAAEHGTCSGGPHRRAAVSVHIQECWGSDSSRLVPIHQASGHRQQSLALM